MYCYEKQNKRSINEFEQMKYDRNKKNEFRRSQLICPKHRKIDTEQISTENQKYKQKYEYK